MIDTGLSLTPFEDFVRLAPSGTSIVTSQTRIGNHVSRIHHRTILMVEAAVP